MVKVEGDSFSSFAFRAPIRIDVLGENVILKRRAIMTRACVFECRGEEREWRYGKKEEGAKMNGHTLLILEKTKMDGKREKVAHLLRDAKEDEMQGSRKTRRDVAQSRQMKAGPERHLLVSLHHLNISQHRNALLYPSHYWP